MPVDNRAPEVLLASATYVTATTTYSKNVNDDYQVGYLVVDITAYAASQTLDILIEAFDRASNSWVTIARIQMPLLAVDTYVYLIGESDDYGGEAVAIPIPLPREWRLACVTSTTDSITYSIGVIPVGR